MSMKRRSPRQSINKSSIIDLILAKFRIDPDGLRRCLPEVAKAIDIAYPTRQSPRSPFGLTERERAYRLNTLESIIKSLSSEEVNRQDALKALEHCAVLIEDDNLPSMIERRILLRLLGLSLGKPLSEVTADTTIEILQNTDGTAVNHITLLRGVVLNLTQDMHLVSVSVIPQRVKESPRAMRFIGMLEEAASGSVGLQDIHREDKHATS